MAKDAVNKIMKHLRLLALRAGGVGLTDSQLLSRFIDSRDQMAFEVLVRRHGPMVLGVCRRLLGNPQDAEDAFQAAFLVLVRKAATVSPRHMVGNWLYGVAQQTALRMRAMNAKRASREKQVFPMPDSAAPAINAEAARRIAWSLAGAGSPHFRCRLPSAWAMVSGFLMRSISRSMRSPPQNSSLLNTIVGTPNTPSASASSMMRSCSARAGPWT